MVVDGQCEERASVRTDGRGVASKSGSSAAQCSATDDVRVRRWPEIFSTRRACLSAFLRPAQPTTTTVQRAFSQLRMVSPIPATASQMEEDPISSTSNPQQPKIEAGSPPKMDVEHEPPQRRDTESGQEAAQPTASSSTHPNKDAVDESNQPATTSGQAQEDSSANNLPSPPPKRQRKQFAADTGRGRRMFGLLNATLGKAKRESEARGDQVREHTNAQVGRL